MIAATFGCCTTNLLPFLKTLFDIALLRKGPQDLPRSPATVPIAILIWLLVILFSQAVLTGLNGELFFLEVLLLTLALTIYYVVLVVNGKRQRISQCFAAILGVGALIYLIFIWSTIIVWRLMGGPGVQFALGAFMIWSVCAKGHIIAQALDRQWFIGAILVFSVFVLQRAIGNVMQVEI